MRVLYWSTQIIGFLFKHIVNIPTNNCSSHKYDGNDDRLHGLATNIIVHNDQRIKNEIHAHRTSKLHHMTLAKQKKKK